MIRRRKSSGNMLSLVMLSIGVIISVGMGGFTFNCFLFQCTRAQSKADAIAMSFASRINAGDRVAQMNVLEECSRELVYVSRQSVEQCSQDDDLSFLNSLCYQLVDEARSGQALVEQERENQIQIICGELQQTARDYNQALKKNPRYSFLWLQTAEPRIESISVGYVANTASNVKTLDVISELSQYDRQQGYIDPASKLYKANIDAKLPQDTDLNFEISSLPAYVDGTCSPPRNANPEAFIKSATVFDKGRATPNSMPHHIPNSVQVTCAMDTSIGTENQALVKVHSTGITTGAIAGSN